jgi:hypothetical protein
MKQTTITIETTSLLILRAGNSKVMCCSACGAEVEMLELSTREISALGKLPRDVHRSDAPDGGALICLKSLLARVQTTKPTNGGPLRLPNTEKERI